MRNPTSNDKQGDPAGDRNGLLDLLAFWRGLTLVLYHFLYRGSRGRLPRIRDMAPPEMRISFGYLGVNLFFMISGYVIIWSASGRDWYGFGRQAGPALSGTSGRHDHHRACDGLVGATAHDHGCRPVAGQPDHARTDVRAAFMDGAYWSIVIEIIFYGWVMIGLFTGVLPRHTDLAVAALAAADDASTT
jgi:peptidoglycan/LPS O-acetylase OafA/YrhL